MEFWEGQLVPERIAGEMKGLQALVGARVVAVGFHAGISEKDGEAGIAFDYEKAGQPHRVILGYNEIGEWIIWQGPIGPQAVEALNTLKLKLLDLDAAFEREVMNQNRPFGVYRDPVARSFTFRIGGVTMLTLSASEVKLLPKEPRRHLVSLDPEDHDTFLAALAMTGFLA